jgi:Transglutaminase-like superfamily
MPMRRWNEFRALTGRKKRFLFAAFIVQSLIVSALRIWGFRPVHAFLQRTSPTPHSAPSTQAEDERPAIEELKNLGRLVNAAANHSPIRTACLTRSLALWWLLRRRGIACDLRIGVSNGMGEFEANAWVEYDGVAINDSPGSVGRFAAFEADFSASALKKAVNSAQLH